MLVTSSWAPSSMYPTVKQFYISGPFNGHSNLLCDMASVSKTMLKIQNKLTRNCFQVKLFFKIMVLSFFDDILQIMDLTVTT